MYCAIIYNGLQLDVVTSLALSSAYSSLMCAMCVRGTIIKFAIYFLGKGRLFWYKNCFFKGQNTGLFSWTKKGGLCNLEQMHVREREKEPKFHLCCIFNVKTLIGTLWARHSQFGIKNSWSFSKNCMFSIITKCWLCLC